MAKKEINRDDSLRALLTEVLPYEVPFPFTNLFFHSHLTGPKSDFPEILLEWLYPSKGDKQYYVPYNYEIRYSGNKKRVLSIVHPASQLMMCEFYTKYSLLIAESCQKSLFSIRNPSKVADPY